MTEEEEKEKEREKKLAELSVQLSRSFLKDAKASGLSPEDGILALLNMTAQGIIEVGVHCENPTDFVGWAAHTFFHSLEYHADENNLDIGIVIEKIDFDDDDNTGGSGGYLN